MVVLQLGHKPVWPQFSQYGQRSLVSVLRLCRSCGLGSQAKAGKAAGTMDGFVSPWLFCRCYLL